MNGIEIEKKLVGAEEISSFYSISLKTARNRISEMKKDPKFVVGDYFRLSGRVWFPAFDEFLKLRDKAKYN